MSNRRLRLIGKLFCLAALTLVISLAAPMRVLGPLVAVPTGSAAQLVQRGVDAYQAGQFTTAIAHWQEALTAYPAASEPDNRAVILQNLAQAYQQTGRYPEALAHQQERVAIYQLTQAWAVMAPALTEQAQLYLYQGEPRQAITLLCGATNADVTCLAGSAIALAEAMGDRHTQVAALGVLGEAYRNFQAFDQAIAYAETRGLALAEALTDVPLMASLHGSIGYTYSQQARAGYQRANAAAQRGANRVAQGLYDAAWQSDQAAQQHLEQSLALFRSLQDVEGELQALMGLFDLLSRSELTPDALDLMQAAASLWETLPDNRAKVALAIRLAKHPQPLVAAAGPTGKPLSTANSQSSITRCKDITINAQTQQRLTVAVDLAKSLENTRLQSFALGELGHLYECRGDYRQALNYTQEARLAAHDAFLAVDGLHLWQWQAGRLYQKLGQTAEAIAAYEQATATLETVRSQILATAKNLQFDFRDAVMPVYQELADLQLAQIPSAQLIEPQTGAGQALGASLGSIDALQLAELQNYFGSDCVIPVASRRLDDVAEPDAIAPQDPANSPLGQSTALISTIILPEHTAVTLTLPNGQRYLQWIDLNENTLRQEILDLLRELQDWGELDFNPERSQRMYDRLIRPFEAILTQAEAIDTLVFVQDGLFRTLPMAALHSGSEYLIERYAIATAPLLSLNVLEPTDVNRLQALFVGVTQRSWVNGNSFPALAFVAEEAAKVEAQLPDTTLLLDQELDLDQISLKEALTASLQSDPYSILHIATHGKFAAESENSFLVLGPDSVITLGELDTLIREVSPNTDPLELIVLSACQTATGDDRAALGLAGVTIRAGAKSAIATLWSVSDATTAELVDEFYRGLIHKGLPKAKALQQAQKHILESIGRKASPGRWAPFTLVGNWQ
ncbi:MAG: CHAT domain-containing protein [Leptolyngbyaceae cyanobacterium]